MFGRVKTALSAKLTAGNIEEQTLDSEGRLLTWPYQARDLTTTAYASLTTGTAATLLTGIAGVKHDLVMVVGSNSSTASATIDIRDATNGGIVATIEVPAGGVAGFVPPTPVPQNIAGDTWTVDMNDITGTTVNVTGLFVKNL